MAMLISSPLLAIVLSMTHLPMALGNLPIAANCLPLVFTDNDVWVTINVATIECFLVTLYLFHDIIFLH